MSPYMPLVKPTRACRGLGLVEVGVVGLRKILPNTERTRLAMSASQWEGAREWVGGARAG